MSSSDSPVVYQREGALARIRFNRPASLNAIDQSLSEALLAICQAIQADPGVRVVLLSGAGKAFLAGGDLQPFHADLPGAPATAGRIIRPLHAALAILTALPLPVLGSLHGAVAGAGVSVALACDLCIAASDTRFNLAYARVATSPDGAATWSLPRVVGLRKALELALLADTFDAAEALRMGLVNRVVAPDALAAETEALAQRLAQGPTIAFGHTKRLMRASFERAMADQMEAECAAFAACAASADFAEGLAAFFEKRRPAFAPG